MCGVDKCGAKGAWYKKIEKYTKVLVHTRKYYTVLNPILRSTTTCYSLLQRTYRATKFAFLYSFRQWFLREDCIFAFHYSGAHSGMTKCVFYCSTVPKNESVFPNPGETLFVRCLCMHKSTFYYYSFEPWPGILREGSRAQNKTNVLLKRPSIDPTICARWFTKSTWNLRFATVLGTRPRFVQKGSPTANEIRVPLRFGRNAAPAAKLHNAAAQSVNKTR